MSKSFGQNEYLFTVSTDQNLVTSNNE